MSRTVMSSIMRRRRGLISAMWKLLSEGWDRHPHPLRQETRYATKPLTPRQRLRSIRRGTDKLPFAEHASVEVLERAPASSHRPIQSSHLLYGPTDRFSRRGRW